MVRVTKYLASAIENVLSATVNFGVESVGSLLSKNHENSYQADFGNENEHLSRFNHGVAVSGRKAITKKQAHENIALFGPTGSGKSSIVIISSAISIARGGSSIVFNDVSGELYERTSAYLAKKGYVILRIDFSNAAKSQAFNPIAYCKTISDIQKAALLIYKNSVGESKSDNFWENSSIMLLSLFIRYLVFHCGAEFRTLQNVLRLVERFAADPTQSVDKLFIKTQDEDLLSAYKATVSMGEKTLQSVIATTRTALNLWNDLEVCKTTASNSFDFTQLREQKVALYVCNPLKDLQYFKPISALFFQSLFNFILSKIPAKNERSIFLLLDESAVMRFPNLSTTISNIRKFNASILLCMQDEMALISQYGQAEAHQIKTNCGCQIYLPGQPLHTCSELSKILGKYTYTDEKTGADKVRELRTVDQIRMSDKAIILIGNSAPLECKVVPYYKNVLQKHLLKNEPYPIQNVTIDTPSLLQFE